jgi:hypothetical protein
MAKRYTIEERVAQSLARHQKLKAQLTHHTRSQDTRRKILLGALMLDRLDTGGGKAMKDWVTRELPGFLTRESDKALFADVIGKQAVANTAAQPAPAREPQATDTPSVPMPMTGSSI